MAYTRHASQPVRKTEGNVEAIADHDGNALLGHEVFHFSADDRLRDLTVAALLSERGCTLRSLATTLTPYRPKDTRSAAAFSE